MTILSILELFSLKTAIWIKIMCKFSVIDNNYLPVAISQDGLVGGCRGFGSCFIGEGSQE